jgi:hypothetical protein
LPPRLVARSPGSPWRPSECRPHCTSPTSGYFLPVTPPTESKEYCSSFNRRKEHRHQRGSSFDSGPRHAWIRRQRHRRCPSESGPWSVMTGTASTVDTDLCNCTNTEATRSCEASRSARYKCLPLLCESHESSGESHELLSWTRSALCRRTLQKLTSTTPAIFVAEVAPRPSMSTSILSDASYRC